MRLLSFLLLFPIAAQAEPESLTVDCLASARASYTAVCTDDRLRALAGEDRRLFEHHRTSGLTTPTRLLTLQLRESDGLFQRDYCIGRGDEFDCIAASFAQTIIEHWQWNALPPLETGLTAPPIELACDSITDPVYALFLPWDPPVMAVSVERRAHLLEGHSLNTQPRYETSYMALTFLSDERATLDRPGTTARCVIR